MSLTGLDVCLKPFIIVNLFDLLLTANKHKQKLWTFNWIFVSLQLFLLIKNLPYGRSYYKDEPVEPQRPGTRGERKNVVWQDVQPDLLFKYTHVWALSRCYPSGEPVFINDLLSVLLTLKLFNNPLNYLTSGLTDLLSQTWGIPNFVIHFAINGVFNY